MHKAAVSACIAFVGSTYGQALSALETQGIELASSFLSTDWNTLVSELGGFISSEVPASAQISDLASLVSEAAPAITGLESELAGYFSQELAEASAPANVLSAAAPIATELVADGISAIESLMTGEYPATMAITAIPAALSTELPEVLSIIPSVAEEIISDLSSELVPIRSELATLFSGPNSASVGGTGVIGGINSTTARTYHVTASQTKGGTLTKTINSHSAGGSGRPTSSQVASTNGGGRMMLINALLGSVGLVAICCML